MTRWRWPSARRPDGEVGCLFQSFILNGDRRNGNPLIEAHGGAASRQTARGRREKSEPQRKWRTLLVNLPLPVKMAALAVWQRSLLPR